MEALRVESERFDRRPSGEAVHSRRAAIIWRPVLCGLTLAAAGLVWWSCARPSPAERSARQFLDAAVAGSYRRMAPLLSGRTLSAVGRSARTRAKFVRGWQRLLTGGYEDARDAQFAIGDIDDDTTGIAIIPVELTADGDRVLAHIRDYDPQFARVPLVMVREGGEWKFDAGRTIDHLVINPGYCDENGCLAQ